MEISIVVVNRNSKSFVNKLIRTLINSCSNYYNCKEIIIVDNGSTDGSLEIYRSYAKNINEPEIKVVPLGRNTGFCYATNMGVRLARSELVAILNPDLYVDADWLRPIMEDFEKMPRLGVVQPLIYWYQKPEEIQATGLYMDLAGNYRANVFGSKTLLAPFGAAYVVRRSAFLEIGGLDPFYFMYHDEVDLGLRMWLAGWLVMLEPKSRVYHYMGGVTPQAPYIKFLKVMLARRNQIFTLVKALSITWLFVSLFLLSLVNIVRMIKSKEIVRSVISAYYDIIRNIRYVALQRQMFSKKRKLNEKKLSWWGIIRPLGEGQ
jgi:GT2 family glycosyltransferase